MSPSGNTEKFRIRNLCRVVLAASVGTSVQRAFSERQKGGLSPGSRYSRAHRMKSNTLKNVLEWVIATGVILSIIFFLQFYIRTKELRNLQLQVAGVQQNQQTLNMLVRETVEYNNIHKDPNLTRILEAIRVPAQAQAGGGTNANPTSR